MIGLILWLIFGLIVGSVAKWILDEETGPWWATAALGGIGSIVGGLIEAVIFGGGYRPSGVLFSIIGAVASVLAYRWYRNKVKP